MHVDFTRAVHGEVVPTETPRKLVPSVLTQSENAIAEYQVSPYSCTQSTTIVYPELNARDLQPLDRIPSARESTRDGGQGSIPGSRHSKNSIDKLPPPHRQFVRPAEAEGGHTGMIALRPPPTLRSCLSYLTRVRRRWIKITSTITKSTPEAIRIIVELSITFPLSPDFHPADSYRISTHFSFPSTIDYFTRVRRRWIRITKTITNSTPETTRMIVELSIDFPFLELQCQAT